MLKRTFDKALWNMTENASTNLVITGSINKDKEIVVARTNVFAAFCFRLSFGVFFFSLVTGGLMEMCLSSMSSFSSFLDCSSSLNSPPDISLIHVAWQQGNNNNNTRAPNDAQFAHLWCTKTKLHPLRLYCAWNWPSKFPSEGCVYSRKFCTVRQTEKSGNSSPLVRHWYHSCDLGSSAMLSAQLYTLYFQALWISGSEN